MGEWRGVRVRDGLGYRKVGEPRGIQLGMVWKGSTWSSMILGLRAEKPEAVADSEAAVKATAGEPD